MPSMQASHNLLSVGQMCDSQHPVYGTTLRGERELRVYVFIVLRVHDKVPHIEPATTHTTDKKSQPSMMMEENIPTTYRKCVLRGTVLARVNHIWFLLSHNIIILFSHHH